MMKFLALSKQQVDTTLLMICLEINKSGIWNLEHNATFSLQEVSTFTFYLRYVVSGDANAAVFESQASFPRVPLRKRLLEIVWYMIWVFGEYPVAVMECCC